MNDDVQPPQTPSADLLAVSASVDGVATVDERGRVAASPDLAAMVDQLRANARSVARVEVPPAGREAAIAAALSVFDELADRPALASQSVNVVSIDRRRPWYRAVAGAAAALLLVVGGVAAIRSSDGDGNDDDISTAIEMSPTNKTADSSGGAADAAGTMFDQAPAAESGVSEPMPMTAADTVASADAEAVASTVAPTIGVIDGAANADSVPVIDDEEQLATYVASASVETSSRTAACVPSGGESLGDVTYQGTLAVVVRNSSTDEVTVVALDDCQLLASIST